MPHGNIYPAERVPLALSGFFRTDNLIALQELALRFLADETDEELLEHLRRHDPRDSKVSNGVWETCGVMVAVTAVPGTDGLIRRAARMAARLRQISMSSTWPPATPLARGPQVHGQAARAGRRCRRPLARDPGRRPGPGHRPFRAGAPDHPHRDRVQPAQPVAAAHWWRLERDPGDQGGGPLGIDVHVIALRKTPPPRRRTVPPGIPASSRLRRRRSPGRLGSKDSSGPGPGVSALPGMTPQIPAPARPGRPG